MWDQEYLAPLTVTAEEGTPVSRTRQKHLDIKNISSVAIEEQLRRLGGKTHAQPSERFNTPGT